jgi:hypothetical protein
MLGEVVKRLLIGDCKVFDSRETVPHNCHLRSSVELDAAKSSPKSDTVSDLSHDVEVKSVVT